MHTLARTGALTAYMAALGELQPGEAGAIERVGLSDRAIKRRGGTAAKPANGRRRATLPSPAPMAALAPEPAAPRAGRGRRRRTA
jgi:hypothetical protein